MHLNLKKKMKGKKLSDFVRKQTKKMLVHFVLSIVCFVPVLKQIMAAFKHFFSGSQNSSK